MLTRSSYFALITLCGTGLGVSLAHAGLVKAVDDPALVEGVFIVVSKRDYIQNPAMTDAHEAAVKSEKWQAARSAADTKVAHTLDQLAKASPQIRTSAVMKIGQFPSFVSQAAGDDTKTVASEDHVAEVDAAIMPKQIANAATESDDLSRIHHTAPSLDRSRCHGRFPAFPINVRVMRDTAAVRLAYRVDDRGRVTSVRVVNSSGFELLDESAMEWVATCRFNPAMNNGVPEAVWTSQEIRFHPRVNALKGTAQCFESYPPYPLESRRDGERGTVVVKYQIGQSGMPVNIEVAKSSGFAHLDASVTEWISGCRFGPDALQDANSEDGWKTQKFSFALRLPAPF